ncbi:MAG: ribonuclease R [Elusimicrobiota bacterium]
MNSKNKRIKGILDKHRSGFGFVIRDDGVKPDIYINKKNLKTAMDRDQVEVKIVSNRKKAKPEGRVVKIIKRQSRKVIGTFVSAKGWKGVLPLGSDAERIDLIENDLFKKVSEGDRVYVHLDRMPGKKKNARGKIIEILGPAGTYKTEVAITLLRNDIKEEFSSGAVKEAKEIPASIDKLDKTGREDLTHLNCFTIDPQSARDFDDAVSIKKTKKGYKLGVHIADVSHFVKENSGLDKEAYDRGTSVYLPGKVIPMLPEKISNNICSLKPHKKRFTISVLMDLDKKGNIRDYRFSKSIIKNKCRFTYDDVDEILAEETYTAKDMYGDLNTMVQLAKKLKKQRDKGGCIDFEFPEVKIDLKEDGKVKTIKREERTMSHRLIEEFMILTNEVVAGHMADNKIPSLYRIHEQPEGEKLESFRNFVKLFGFTLPEDKKITPQHLQTILDRIRKSKEEVVISTMMLRSLQQAVYSQHNKGHFALALDNYTHFTSPIRRYPDLIVHRIVSELAKNGKLSQKKEKKYRENLEKWGEELSKKERSAGAAQMESKELKLMEFMKDRLGDVFEGIISGVTSFGVFVELNMGLEGLIHVRDLNDDYYIFSEDKMVLRGKRTGKKFKIGNKLKVQLARIDLEKRQVDFKIVRD